MTANIRERAERTERPERDTAQTEVRERRMSATLDRWTRSKLNPFNRADLDHKNFKYRWFIDDHNGRIRDAYNRDWEYVVKDDIKNFDPSLFNTESEGRVRHNMGGGIFGYFMKKRVEWYEQDQRAKLERHRANTGNESLMERGGSTGVRQSNNF